MLFGFGSLVLMILPTFLLVKTGCKETPIFNPRLSSCRLVLSAAFWLMKGRENMTLGVEAFFLSVSLCIVRNDIGNEMVDRGFD